MFPSGLILGVFVKELKICLKFLNESIIFKVGLPKISLSPLTTSVFCPTRVFSQQRQGLRDRLVGI